jgi:hypothetical protein
MLQRNGLNEIWGKLRSLLGSVPETILAGQQLWGMLRFLAAGFIIYLLACWSRSVWWSADGAPEWMLSIYSLRYWVLPVGVLVGGLLVGANYIRRLYSLPRLGPAFHYIWSGAFGMAYPNLNIRDGRAELKTGETNLLRVIGGPGYINVRPDSAVLLESLAHPTNVYGAGLHFVSRLERIRELVSLADQHSTIEQTRATTKDGIPINVRNINFRYRLRTGHRPRDHQLRTPADPYPFSVQAIRDMAYRRSTTQDGVQSWDRMVQLRIDGAITDYIRPRTFDQVAMPKPGEDPRTEIARQVLTKPQREALRAAGTELLWCDIGHLDPAEEEVKRQQMDTWGEWMSGIAMLERADADATRLRYQEMGRAEAQAELLKSIVDALERSAQGNPGQNLRSMIIIRTAQILEAMAEQEQLPYLR